MMTKSRLYKYKEEPKRLSGRTVKIIYDDNVVQIIDIKILI